MELMVLVHAIQDVARAAVGATANTKLRDTLNTLRDMVFPEWAEKDQSKKKSTQEILKREFESGPIKVQSASYETPKQRKNSKRTKLDAKQRR
jgi:hypothetical protein